ncbi:uncharacterized protein LOC116805019 [Drosophila grimshawi]|uniref:uncharacterized protein LOC116805019 n=1 Tax=Drosophila grimshawi TaxID=7222 RepID=UPI000C86E867|nr:uncharacterized protein LOC116805019 [Drosophila grimshawi]
MCKFLDLGLGISIINVFYSLTYFLMWCVAQQHTIDNDIEPFVWLSVYTFNIFLNVYLFLGLRKRDRLAVIIWFSFTLLWFVPKLYDHKRGCRLDERGSTYQVFNLIVEGYVTISLLVLIVAYIYFPKWGHKTNPDPHEIQMLELTMATLATEQEKQKCMPKICSNLDPQVSSFEFHRAADVSDD